MKTFAIVLCSIPVAVGSGFALGNLIAYGATYFDSQERILHREGLQYWWGPAGAFFAIVLFPIASVFFLKHRSASALLFSLTLVTISSFMVSLFLSYIHRGDASWIFTLLFSALFPIIIYHTPRHPNL
jgi:hypothetical protein